MALLAGNVMRAASGLPYLGATASLTAGTFAAFKRKWVEFPTRHVARQDPGSPSDPAIAQPKAMAGATRTLMPVQDVAAESWSRSASQTTNHASAAVRPRQTGGLHRNALAVCALLALSACQSPPKIYEGRKVDTSEEVANVFVSAYPAVPWTAISAKLEPKNNLSITDARAMAAVSTQSQVSQFLSTFAAGLAVGLPTNSRTSTTTLAADQTSTTTGSRTRGPGTVPSTPAVVGVPVTDASLNPDLSKTPSALGVDASTQLTVGTGIYQLAQILDNQISQAVAPEGYQAHLLTFQVNLQPRSRDLSYDAYINLTLMRSDLDVELSRKAPSGTEDELPPIIVYPLVIADALESSTAARSVEVIRQAALTLSGIVNNFGVGGNLSGGSDNLQSLFGSDRNSLVTVGRISDHTLRIRLGAQLQGTRALAMVPRTHNISVVVFTKEDLRNKKEDIERLSVVTKASFVDTDDGKELPSSRNTPAGRDILAGRVRQALKDYGYGFSDYCKDETHAVDVVRALDRSDYSQLIRCLSGHPNLNDVGEETRLKRVIAELMTVQTDSRYSKLVVQLTSFEARKVGMPDPGQLALLQDDKSGAKVTLRGGSNLTAKRLTSKLRFTLGVEPVELPASGIDVDADGKTVTLTFPSLVGNQLINKTKNPNAGKPDLEKDPDPILLSLHLTGDAPACDCSRPYKVRLVRAETKAAANPVSVSVSYLTVDGSGTAKLALMVGPWDAKKQGNLAIKVSGADVRASDPATTLDFSRRAINVNAESLVTLTLSNLTTAQPIQLITLAGKEAVGGPIVVTVQPQLVMTK